MYSMVSISVELCMDLCVKRDSEFIFEVAKLYCREEANGFRVSHL